MIQLVVWSPGSPSHVLIERVPFRVWTLFNECDANKIPELPIVPIHNRNAFLEDQTHDWIILRDGRLRYYSRVMGPEDGCWLLLEVKPDEEANLKASPARRKLDEILSNEEARQP